MPDLQPPRQTPGTFTDAQVAQMSESLKLVGLTCEENTPEKMLGYIDTVSSNIKGHAGTTAQVFMAAPEAKEYEYIVDNTNVNYSKMSVIVANFDKVESQGLYHVDKHYEERDFEDTSAGAITDALSSMGSIISDVASGSVNPEQVTSHLGDTINALTASESDDYYKNDEKILFCFAKPPEGTYDSPSICGMWYNFEMKIHNYKDKKVSEHEANYKITQKNVAFSDDKIFDEVYQAVKS